MLNSATTSRLQAHFDSRRRSSTSTAGNIPSGSHRQVERIYDSDHNDSSGEESTGTNIESQQQSNAQHKLLDPVEDSTVKHPPFSYSSQKVGSRHERRKSRRLSIRHRYSISNKVTPSSFPRGNESSTKPPETAIAERIPSHKSDGVSKKILSHRSKLERRGSRLLRYSIAKRIKDRSGEDMNEMNLLQIGENDDDVSDAIEIGGHSIDKPCYIFLPNNKYRGSWDIGMTMVLALMLFYIPFRVCMYWDVDVESEAGTNWFEVITDFAFGIDIIFNFITAYRDPQTKLLVSNPRRIGCNYLKGFFVVDLLATIPFGYILTETRLAQAGKIGKLGKLPKMIRIIRAVRLLKLLRVYKLQLFILRLETEFNIHHGITRMIKILLMVGLVTHLAGCFWHLVGLTGGDDILDGGWIVRYSYDEKTVTLRYIASLYWSFSTLTTVGYGDISARTPQEQIYSMLMMLLGVSWYAYIVSSMATVMSSFDAQQRCIRDKMICVNEFIRGARLPSQLAKQVRNFFEFKLANSKRVFLLSNQYEADELLYELSSQVRSEILIFMEQDLISRVPFLTNKVPQFIADTVSMFQPMVFRHGEYIVKEGSQADEMFFIIKGEVGIYYGEKHVLSLQEGNYFGEIGCMMGGIRRAGVKAQSDICELQALSRRNLNILLTEYPDVGDELKRVAKDRAKEVKRDKITPSTSIENRNEEVEVNMKSPTQNLVHVSANLTSNVDSIIYKHFNHILKGVHDRNVGTPSDKNNS